MGNSRYPSAVPLPPPPVSPLTPTRGSVILYEYRHDCSERNHTLLVNVTLDGFELVCPRCRVENKENARVVIAWREILAMMLLAWRTRE